MTRTIADDAIAVGARSFASPSFAASSPRLRRLAAGSRPPRRPARLLLLSTPSHTAATALPPPSSACPLHLPSSPTLHLLALCFCPLPQPCTCRVCPLDPASARPLPSARFCPTPALHLPMPISPLYPASAHPLPSAHCSLAFLLALLSVRGVVGAWYGIMP